VKPNKSSDNRNGLQFQPGGRFTATNYALKSLIGIIAYQPGIRRMIADPKWDNVLSEHFDVVANAEGNPTREQTRLMLQSLLADRFKLVVHFETRPIPVYALVLASPGKMGPGLKPHSSGVKCIPVGPQQQGFGDFPTPWCGGMRMAPISGGVHQIGNNVTVDTFANLLALSVDRVVVDRTGLNGYFDADFEYAFTQGQGAVPRPSVEASDPSAPPSIFTAMQEQLGLKLEARTRTCLRTRGRSC
jgi:bla regulator protein blaR1